MIPHEEIIKRGFRETGRKAGKTRYTRGAEMILHKDYGPSPRWANDAGRHILQYFRNGRKVSGGTAWYAILAKYVDVQINRS